MSVKNLVELAAGKKAAAFETSLNEELKARLAESLVDRRKTVISEMFGLTETVDVSEEALDEMTIEELEALDEALGNELHEEFFTEEALDIFENMTDAEVDTYVESLTMEQIEGLMTEASYRKYAKNGARIGGAIGAVSGYSGGGGHVGAAVGSALGAAGGAVAGAIAANGVNNTKKVIKGAKAVGRGAKRAASAIKNKFSKK